MIDIEDIKDMGEESGRDESADHYPYLLPPNYRLLYRYGRARAQGLYELRGKAARAFAYAWAVGYEANIDMWKRDGLLPGEESDEQEDVA